MRGSYEVDVVTFHRLQFEHDVDQPLGGHGRAALVLADVEVLAEDAAQVALGEENRAAAAPSAQAVLLTQVREVTADAGLASGAAGSGFTRQPVDAALARAGLAGLQPRDGLRRPALKFAAVMEAEIGGGCGHEGIILF